jgi:hypothetical protein
MTQSTTQNWAQAQCVRSPELSVPKARVVGDTSRATQGNFIFFSIFRRVRTRHCFGRRNLEEYGQRASVQLDVDTIRSSAQHVRERHMKLEIGDSNWQAFELRSTL